MRVAEMVCTFQRCYRAICARFRDVVNLSEILCTFHNIVHAMTLLFGGGGNREGGVAGLWGGEGWGVKVETSYALNFLLELPTCS